VRNCDEAEATYVAKKSTMTGFSLCSTLASKSLSSWIVTISLDDDGAVKWRKDDSCWDILDSWKLLQHDRGFIVEASFVVGLHVHSGLTGKHLGDLQSICLLTCSATLEAITTTTMSAC